VYCIPFKRLSTKTFTTVQLYPVKGRRAEYPPWYQLENFMVVLGMKYVGGCRINVRNIIKYRRRHAICMRHANSQSTGGQCYIVLYMSYMLPSTRYVELVQHLLRIFYGSYRHFILRIFKSSFLRSFFKVLLRQWVITASVLVNRKRQWTLPPLLKHLSNDHLCGSVLVATCPQNGGCTLFQ
jgi:hypothetical protein